VERRSEDENVEQSPPGQDVPPDYLAPLDPEDDEGFIGVDLEPIAGATRDEEPGDRRQRATGEG
jgi:hypothetical protein